ncbi:hypothetical protein CPB84DRAFT_1853179 [Gymnopilus junonius]|uniref:AMP-dependent synthetase/ligase domain-containing protein n=1 Tax=Gymnopilus junonius TaxID=109634 RepID=A0A9P5NAK8_GYMJU|nr:hypothetical protein CPB84DRAFT_1853179 [Gymnopilus junonius]
MSLDSITTLDSLLTFRAEDSPNHRFLIRPVEDTANTAFEEITYGIFDFHVSQLAKAWMIEETAKKPEGSQLRPKAVVGVFFPSGYTLAVVMFALIRLGVVPFCLSLETLRKASSTSVKTIFQNDDQLRVRILEVARSDLAYCSATTEAGRFSYPQLSPGLISGQDTVVLQHTSGSTAFPKPVKLSNALLLRSIRGGSWWVEGFHSQSDIALGQPPIFHVFGFIGGLLNALLRGHTFAFPPLPPSDNGGLFPSSDTLRSYATRISATEFFGVSSTVVGLARCEGGMELFKSMRRVVVGGAPMPRANGDWIVQHGVHLVEVFGSTEAGSLLNSNRPVGDPAWQSMRVCSNLPHHFEPYGPAPHTVFELVLHSSPLTGEFSAADTQTGYFHTHDLFQEWPNPGSGTWRHCGRSDDVLLLSSGQNWNPRPMELQIEAVLNGSTACCHLWTCPSASWGTHSPRASGPGSMVADVEPEAREAIWAAIQVANAVAPSNARIARDSVLLVTAKGVVPLDDPKTEPKNIPIADKGTPLRAKTYALFAEEIDSVYKGVV